MLTKNFTVFIKFWRFNAFFDEAFTVTSRSKTIAALRLCVLESRWQWHYCRILVTPLRTNAGDIFDIYLSNLRNTYKVRDNIWA
jgi:hypothetical protein